jgi:CheY-like chemotaxis protein
VRLTLARALTERAYDVRTAADGPAAVTILEGLGILPDAVITDLHMASGSGEELARMWRFTGLRTSLGRFWRSRSGRTNSAS